MARKRKGNPVHGWVVFDKPLEMTSTQAVGKTRWLFTAQKAGHGGTLDPLATGILPIALGDATKTVPFTMDADKDYTFTISWGENRDTMDAEGEVIATSDARPNLEDIKALLPSFVGDIEQVPPKYSAIKVDGRRAYDLMRGGGDVELKSRIVHVDALSIVENEVDALTLKMTCGKGTYVRSIARDLAAELGVCGYVSYLRRTRVGTFDETNSFSLDDLEKLCHRGGVLEALRPVQAVLDDIPVMIVTEKEAIDLKHGRAIATSLLLDQDEDADNPPWILTLYNDKAIALCYALEGQLAPKRVFNL